MTFQVILFDVALVIFLYMTLVFILSLLKKDNSIVDIFWGPGFLLIMVYAMIQSGEVDLRKLIVSLLVLLWSMRLAYHIWLRGRGRGEDFRYKAWRDTWKYFYVRSFFQVFMLQGLFMLIISAPVWFIGFRSSGLPGIWEMVGLIVFGVGFMIETIADSQLEQFRKDPSNKGKLMTTGLWAYSRHPNYFGEALLWWGIGLYAVALPGGWYTLAGPMVITLLLRYVSGVPMLEKKYEGRADWAEYKSKTPVFVPFLKRG